MTGKQTVLVIDDDKDFQELVMFMLDQQGIDAVAVSSPRDIGSRNISACNAILLDWQLGDSDGTKLITPLKQKFQSTPIIFVTAHSTPELAAESIKLGAFDFLTKPLDSAKLMVTMAQAFAHGELIGRLQKLEESSSEVGFDEMVGTSPQMKTIYSIIRNVAPTDVNVMVCGESGTGKELAASAIHRCSDRSAAPFVPINMAAIPAALAESTLFGHEKGAFTGAESSRLGAVAEASGGTLFLDEITEMHIDLQSKLLRFLQERVYRPLGGNQDITAEVRIISATNRDPLQAVKDKRLREDLFYRLNVIPLNLPPLRERDGDIALLAIQFVKQFAAKYKKSFKHISTDAIQKLESYDWPGNVRQLWHLIQRTVVLHNGNELQSHMLPEELQPNSLSLDSPTDHSDEPPELIAEQAEQPEFISPLEQARIIPLEQLERMAISHALKICDGSAYDAARQLGISPATMYRRIKLYSLDAD